MTVGCGRKAASHGSAGYSQNQQMVRTASSPQGNSKTELVKSVTIHGGKCLAVPANANEAHVRSKKHSKKSPNGDEQEETKFDLKMMLRKICFSLSLAWGQRLYKRVALKDASDIQIATVSVSCERPPSPNTFHHGPGQHLLLLANVGPHPTRNREDVNHVSYITSNK